MMPGLPGYFNRELSACYEAFAKGAGITSELPYNMRSMLSGSENAA